jgi:septal ring factor EnvC (AmiA/AmiB activator)
MSQDEFTKLFTYIEKRFDSIDQKLDTKSSQDSLDRLTNTIDSFVKRLDNSETEQASRDLQFERLLVWAREVSKKTGVPLINL